MKKKEKNMQKGGTRKQKKKKNSVCVLEHWPLNSFHALVIESGLETNIERVGCDLLDLFIC